MIHFLKIYPASPYKIFKKCKRSHCGSPIWDRVGRSHKDQRSWSFFKDQSGISNFKRIRFNQTYWSINTMSEWSKCLNNMDTNVFINTNFPFNTAKKDYFKDFFSVCHFFWLFTKAQRSLRPGGEVVAVGQLINCPLLLHYI